MNKECPICNQMVKIKGGCFVTHDKQPPFRRVCPGSKTICGADSKDSLHTQLDKAADFMAEEILSGSPDIGKCFATGLKAMRKEKGG